MNGTLEQSRSKGHRGIAILPAAILLLAICSAILVASDVPDELAGRLQSALDRGIENEQSKGLSAAIIFPDGEIWTGVGGVSHGDVPIRCDTAFAAGSSAKSFTAAIVHQLVEEGVLDLDDTVGEWLPEMAHVDPAVTVRDLLCHRSGLHNFIRHPEYWITMLGKSWIGWTAREALETFLLEPYSPSAGDFHYSQANYSLLRMLIEEATGSTMAVEYRARLFSPLAFETAATTPYEPYPDGFAHGWWDFDSDGVYDDFTAISRTAFGSSIGGEIFCTATELATWARALFVEGRVLRPESLAEMTAFQGPCPDEPLVDAYGLGALRFSPEIFGGLTVWGHSGNAPGYAAACLYLPDYGVCVGFMDNTEAGDGMGALSSLLEIVSTALDAGP